MFSNISQDVYAALKEFGLTDYETRAFIALIANGVSSAKQLSEKTDIPYSRIYDVLVNLENIGWVNVISGRPMKYRAIRPINVARLAKEQLEEKYARIEYALIEKLEPLFGREQDLDATPIWILNGDILNKVKEMITSTENELILFLKYPNEDIIEEYFEELLEINESRVNIKVILNKNKFKIINKNVWRKLSSIAEIQLVDQPILFDCMMFDKSEMIIFLTTFFKIQVKEENMVFLITEKQLLNYTKNYLILLWDAGEELNLKDF